MTPKSTFFLINSFWLIADICRQYILPLIIITVTQFCKKKKKLKKRETKTKRQNMVLSPQLALYSQSQLDLYMKFAPTLSIYSMSHLDWNKRCKRYLRWKKIVKWKSSWNYMFWHFFMPCFSLPCLSVKPLSQFEAILSFYFLSTKVKKNDNLFY